MLWIQEVEKMKKAKFEKIKGTKNPADLMTKGVNKEKLKRYMSTVRQEPREGRASIGLQCSAGI